MYVNVRKDPPYDGSRKGLYTSLRALETNLRSLTPLGQLAKGSKIWRLGCSWAQHPKALRCWAFGLERTVRQVSPEVEKGPPFKTTISECRILCEHVNWRSLRALRFGAKAHGSG